MKDKRLQRKDICETECSDVTYRDRFEIAPEMRNEGGEEEMTEEKIFTPFDGLENDWISFAKQQAAFYRNAEQYIINLRIDIKEIEDEIEKTLLETEDANCNVAQGYKVFKKLKELRIERKSKARELDCLYALTDYIDCDALADTCEANLSEVEEIMGIQAYNEEIQIQTADSIQEKIDLVEDIKDMVG